MQTAVLLLSTILVAGDPIADFEFQGVRLGMSTAAVKRRIPPLLLDRDESDPEAGYTCWESIPGELPYVDRLTLTFWDDRLQSIGLQYGSDRVEEAGIGAFCDAIVDRLGEPEQIHEHAEGTLYFWHSTDEKVFAQLHKQFGITPSAFLSFSVYRADISRRLLEIMRRKDEQRKSSVDPGF